MNKAFLYDRLGYVVGEPNVPEPPPQVVLWGEDAFLAGCPAEDGRPQYYWATYHVIAETRENPSFH